MEAMFEGHGDLAMIAPWLREGISWIHGDANDPQLASVLGHPDIVLANRFLCHMKPAAAESCLRNIGRLVKLGGYLFVSGIDLDAKGVRIWGDGSKPFWALLAEFSESLNLP